MQNKQNISVVDAIFFSNFRSQDMLQPPQQQQITTKRHQVKPTKNPKNANNNIRAGDWVCLVCNNLNFSFRNQCNRCQMQTKKQNYIQNLLLISDKKSPLEFENHIHEQLNEFANLPFRPDIHQHQKFQNQQGQLLQKPYGHEYNINEFGPNTFPHHNTNPPKNGPLSTSNNDSSGLENQTKITNHDNKQENSLAQNNHYNDFDFSPKLGFENVILLTPPRYSQHAYHHLSPIPDAYNANQFLLPYQSPKQLPSVSPILRKVLLYNDQIHNDDHNYNKHNLKYLNFKKICKVDNPQNNSTQEPKYSSNQNDGSQSGNSNLDANDQQLKGDANVNSSKSGTNSSAEKEDSLQKKKNKNFNYNGVFVNIENLSSKLVQENISPSLLRLNINENVESNEDKLSKSSQNAEKTKNVTDEETKSDDQKNNTIPN